MNWKCSDNVSPGFKNQGETCLAKGLRGWAKSLKSDLRCCDEPKLPPVSRVQRAWGKGPQGEERAPFSTRGTGEQL